MEPWRDKVGKVLTEVLNYRPPIGLIKFNIMTENNKRRSKSATNIDDDIHIKNGKQQLFVAKIDYLIILMS